MITKEMTISEVLHRYPQTLAVFHRFGLSCGECQIADYEDVGHGAGVHKIDVDLLLRELNLAAGTG